MSALPCISDVAQREYDALCEASDRLLDARERIDSDVERVAELFDEDAAWGEGNTHLLARIAVHTLNLWPLFERLLIGASMSAGELREIQDASRDVRTLRFDRERLVTEAARTELRRSRR